MKPIFTKAQQIGDLLSAVLFGQPGKVEERSEDRSLVRYRIKTRVAVHWREADGQKRLSARGVDMSEYGASIESAKLIPPGTSAWVDFEELRLTGSARVKHCTRRGSKYRIGLHFSGPLMRPL